jgi:hypothetical protein
MKNLLLFIALALTLNTMMAQGDGRTEYFINDIKDAQADIEKYTSPQERTYLVRPALEPWLMRAVSMKAREEWAQTTSMTPEQKKQVDDAFKALATIAAKKIPLNIPAAKKFALGSQAEKDLLMTNITDAHTIDVYRIGIEDQNWRIEKDDYNMPTGRRKWAYIYYKKKSGLADYPYCRLMELYIYQPYAGGGTYGENTVYREQVTLCGCPK